MLTEKVVHEFGPKHIYRIQKYARLEGSVSQGNVHIKFTFKGVPSNHINTKQSRFIKQKYTVGYLHIYYSTGFHISVMQEHNEFVSYWSTNQPFYKEEWRGAAMLSSTASTMCDRKYTS